MKFIFFFLCIFQGLPSVLAQNKKITFETTAEIIWSGVDRAGDLFLVLKTGEVQKFNKGGKRIGSHGFKVAPTLLDPLDGVQSFYYLRDDRIFGNLSFDLSSVSQHPIDPAFAISPWLVCPTLHELWILDSSDFSIKKTKMNSASISLEKALKHLPFKKVTDYIFMREYQNYLFLLDKNEGVHLFNSLGNYVKTMGEKEMRSFGFLGEELYYLKDNVLILIDLYTNERRTLPLPALSRNALLTDDTMYVVAANSVMILDFKP